jgi:hypothetical protein
MDTGQEISAAFDSIFEAVHSVTDQAKVVQTAIDALIDTVDQYGDSTGEDPDATAEMLVAVIGACIAGMRVLVMHLNDTTGPETPNQM